MTETLDRSSAIPLYVQLTDLIRDKITNGEWKPDQKIPSENELNKIYGISRMTARQVLARLVDEDLLFRVQGKGTFVSHRKISTRSPSYQGIREQLEQQGYATRTELLGATLVEPDAKIAARLDLRADESVYLVRRLRYVEDSPISLHESYVPTRLAADLLEHDVVGEQLCHVLEKNYSLRMTTVTETLETASASKPVATALEVRPGAPLLLLEQRIADGDGVPFELTRITFRGDKIRLEFHYDL
jgi:GntR family transcriptional regulator